ncbi:MAG: LysM peptidoglycan-binding domain-containing protein [Ferruginibacter sp.]
MKNFLFLFLVIPSFGFAQQLMIEGAAPNQFLVHATAAKESFYSIGRLYNISPKEIAPYNKLILENGLTIGQVIKIPLTAANFVQSFSSATDEALVPVYYTVKKKETLFHIGSINKVSVADIKTFNKLKTDAAIPGAKLIVGYLKVKKDLSAYASKAVKNVPAEKPMEIVEHALDKPKIDEPLKTVTAPVTQTVPANNPPVKAVEQTVSAVTKSGNASEGFFKGLYTSQAAQKSTHDEKGMGGVFKSTSGWEDGKYYCLQNKATAGTIIKITANNMTVYAKVLDAMPDMKQNEGMLIRISSAAAASLGVTDGKFECSLNY